MKTEETPIYQQIARKALHLSELALNNSAIARDLKASDKTVCKAINWIQTARRMIS
ncbi:MAG: hypothetical protein ABIJ00_14550 [Candidatus Eisenbacteria bacterium]